MSVFTAGAMANTNNSWYAKLDKNGQNVMYVLHPALETILSAPKFGVFVPRQPFNASWVSIGAQDVGEALGLRPTPKAYIWVYVPKDKANPQAGGDVKLWEANKGHFETIAAQVTEFENELQGLQLLVGKDSNGRWQCTASKPSSKKALPAATLNEAWNTVVDAGLAPGTPKFNVDAFGKVVGLIPSNVLQRKFLIERAGEKAKSWNDVLALFGFPPVADGGAIEEDNDVEPYGS